MAQPNNNNGRKPKESFFKKELKNYRVSVPVDFLAGKNAYQANKICKNICRDIAMGNIDPLTEYSYFTRSLISALVNFTYSKWYYHSIIAEAVQDKYNYSLNMYGGSAVDVNMISIITENQKSAQLYSLLYQGFLAMSTDGNVSGWLQTMMSQLGQGKYAGNI